MTKRTFHLTPHASSRLYRFISSPTFRLIHLSFTLLAIFFFSIGVGLAHKYIEADSYWDLGLTNDFPEKVSLGLMFLSFVWLVFSLFWRVLKKPKLHPGYYVGFDLYIGLSLVSALATLFAYSEVVFGYDFDICDHSWYIYGMHDDVSAEARCTRHLPAIRGIDITAYSFGFLVG
ncbi:MAG: hypothetical protein Q9209_004405 [Squamulea sp. 1 TL-2023]